MNEENRKRVEDIRAELAALPKGGLVTKARGGKTYHYHRWADNGVRHDDYVAPDRLGELKAQMDRKRSLQQELKALRGSQSSAAGASAGRDASPFATSVRLAEDALADAQLAAGLRKRLGFQALEAFLRGPQQDKVLALYGLRRTGKTTMIRQAVLGMAPEDLRKTALMQVGRGNTLFEVNRDLLRLKRLGCRYVFIDEVTLLEDFIEGAALFSDVYAAGGMKIVLSGADSLGLLISSAEELFDRCHLLHTTVIPYQEFEEVLGVRGIDKFIRFGGTMSMSGGHDGSPGTFAAKEQADAYVSSAIAENMQRSLRRCRDGAHLRRLRGLCDRGELADAINRVVEDINRRFALDILTRDFRSSSLSIPDKNLMKDRSAPSTILHDVDVAAVTQRLRAMLEIRNKDELSARIREEHAVEIKEYLRLLDVLAEIPVEHLPAARSRSPRPVITQPGLRYAQACALIKSLMKEPLMKALPVGQRLAVIDRILSEMQGRMLEDIILFETAIARPDKEVLKVQFAVGEFDMLVFDEEDVSCEIYEIKHSAKAAPEQRRHLLDGEKLELARFHYGRVKRRCVLYLGEPAVFDGIEYANAEDYLRALPHGERAASLARLLA